MAPGGALSSSFPAPAPPCKSSSPSGMWTSSSSSAACVSRLRSVAARHLFYRYSDVFVYARVAGGGRRAESCRIETGARKRIGGAHRGSASGERERGLSDEQKPSDTYIRVSLGETVRLTNQKRTAQQNEARRRRTCAYAMCSMFFGGVCLSDDDVLPAAVRLCARVGVLLDPRMYIEVRRMYSPCVGLG